MEITRPRKLISRYIVKYHLNCDASVIFLNSLPQLNGINTQGENIADNGGIKEAYRAYQSWVDRNGQEQVTSTDFFLSLGPSNVIFFLFVQKLPGLQYSSNQLFWISAANVWCNKYRPESLKLRILTGVHSPGEFRVRGPFSNMEQFAKVGYSLIIHFHNAFSITNNQHFLQDFNCPARKPMNPEKKCSVW